MSKPFMGVSASGCHHNMSLWRGGKDEFVKMGNDPKALPGMKDNYMHIKGGENTFMPDGDDVQMPQKAGLEAIQAAEAGVLIYLRGHEGRGIGLGAKLEAYTLQDEGRDTIEANEDLGHPVDARDYEAGAAILRDLGVSRVRLLTNNPAKCEALEELGIKVVERIPVVTEPNEENYKYLLTKQKRMGHLLGLTP